MAVPSAIEEPEDSVGLPQPASASARSAMVAKAVIWRFIETVLSFMVVHCLPGGHFLGKVGKA